MYGLICDIFKIQIANRQVSLLLQLFFTGTPGSEHKLEIWVFDLYDLLMQVFPSSVFSFEVKICEMNTCFDSRHFKNKISQQIDRYFCWSISPEPQHMSFMKIDQYMIFITLFYKCSHMRVRWSSHPGFIPVWRTHTKCPCFMGTPRGWVERG